MKKYQRYRKAIKLFIPIIFFAITNTTFGSEIPEHLPLPKTGACPSGYIPNGSYCIPGKNANYGIEKNGQCPSGYFPNGDYCIAKKKTQRLQFKNTATVLLDGLRMVIIA